MTMIRRATEADIPSVAAIYGRIHDAEEAGLLTTGWLRGVYPTEATARAAIAAAPGCRLVDDLDNKVYPMPLDTSDQDIVFVGRIRDDLTDEKGLSLWCCGDQIRKGAATNAIQIAELLIQ